MVQGWSHDPDLSNQSRIWNLHVQSNFLVEYKVQQRAEENAVWDTPAEKKKVHNKEIEVKSNEF